MPRINIEKAQVIKIGSECFVKVSSVRDAVDFDDHIAITLKRGTVIRHAKEDRQTQVLKSDATEYVPHEVKDITLENQADAGVSAPTQRPIGFNTERSNQ